MLHGPRLLELDVKPVAAIPLEVGLHDHVCDRRTILGPEVDDPDVLGILHLLERKVSIDDRGLRGGGNRKRLGIRGVEILRKNHVAPFAEQRLQVGLLVGQRDRGQNRLHERETGQQATGAHGESMGHDG